MEIIIAIIAGIPSLATLVYAIIKDKRQNKSALNRAVGFLLLNRLTEWCMECVDRGEITRKQLQYPSSVRG